MKYQSTQTGWLMIIVFSLTIALITLSYLLEFGDNPLPFSVYIILLFVFIAVLLVYYRLKIVVDGTKINVIYGIGLVHFKIKPEVIHSVKVVKVLWIYGLGIRYTSKGMLYNIQGRNAVEISYQDGKEKTVLIGCKEPIELKGFIEKAFLRVSIQ